MDSSKDSPLTPTQPSLAASACTQPPPLSLNRRSSYDCCEFVISHLRCQGADGSCRERASHFGIVGEQQCSICDSKGLWTSSASVAGAELFVEAGVCSLLLTAFGWSCASSPSRVMMSKSHPKSTPKSRKRSVSKGKHGGLAAKEPMEAWKPAATTVKERKPLYHYVWDLGRKLFRNLVRMLFSSGPRENKEPSLSSERPDATSSSSALATPSGVSVAAKRASEKQTEGPAAERLSFGTVNDKNPCYAPNSTGNSNEVSELDLEPVFSKHNGEIVGEHFPRDDVGLRKSKTEEAGVSMPTCLPVIAEDEIKSERPGTDSQDWKKRYYDEKKGHDDLKKKCEIFDKTVVLRQTFIDIKDTEEFKSMNNEIKKEVLKLAAAKSEEIDMILDKTTYTMILRTMLVQKVNMDLKESFSDKAWRKRNLFPNFINDGAQYLWWEQNFVPKTLEKRLDILREAAKNWNPERDIFLVVELVTELNSTVHPPQSEKDRVEIFSLATTISSLRSGGDSKV